MDSEVIPDDVVSLFNSDILTNKNFEKDINYFVEEDKSDKIGSGKSTTQTTKENKNKTETNKNEKIMDYSYIENYLVEGKLPVKEFKDSNNFVKKSNFPEKMREILKKSMDEFTPNPEKVNEQMHNFASLFQIKQNNSPSILIMETIVDNTLYTVYQDLINYNFYVIAYNLERVIDPNKSNYLIIRNFPYLNKNNLDEYYYYKNYFSDNGKKKIKNPPTDKISNNKSKKKRF